MGLLTRIMMKPIQRHVTRHKKRQKKKKKRRIKKKFTDILGSVFFVDVGLQVLIVCDDNWN